MQTSSNLLTTVKVLKINRISKIFNNSNSNNNNLKTDNSCKANLRLMSRDQQLILKQGKGSNNNSKILCSKITFLLLI